MARASVGSRSGFKDFTPVNGDADTWSEKDGVIHCTGRPVGVRARKAVHELRACCGVEAPGIGGNSGIFVWTAPDRPQGFEARRLPKGIEVQILDHGYTDKV